MKKVPWQGKIVTFFSNERERLIRYVRRLIDDTAERDAEDIVQDVILNIFSRADVTIPFENLTAYAYQALRNRIIDYLRKRRDMASLDDEYFDNSDLTLSDVLQDPQYDWNNEELRLDVSQRLFKALAVLNDEQKAVIIATELEGWTFQELSGEWNVPLGTLLARKSRALHKIRETFSDSSQ